MPFPPPTVPFALLLALGPASPRGDVPLIELEPPTGASSATEAAPTDGSAAPSGGMFDPDKLGGSVSMPGPGPGPESSSGGAEAPATGSKGAPPPMPEIEELPPRPTVSRIVAGGAADRKPVAGGGVGFFDPGKLKDDSSGGGVVQIRGYIGLNFAVSERTDLTSRDPDSGRFERLKTLPYFGGGAAQIFVGAPIYADVVYARMAFEFLSIPRAEAGAADVTPGSMPEVIMESAALEVNPFAWAKKAPDWFRRGFKITGGVFVVPFGLEDQQHDAPVRWWVTRPLAMSTGRVYPGSWIDIGAVLKWKPTFQSRRSVRPIEIDVGVVNGDPCTQTRAMDLLYRYRPIGQVDEVCERNLRAGEMGMTGTGGAMGGPTPGTGSSNQGGATRGDGSVLGITPDNNGNKAFLARLQVMPIGALNVGGSFVWGTHPPSTLIADVGGQSYPDVGQAATWRAGAHFELNFDEAFQTRYPLPHIRGEFVYGIDRAVDPSEGGADDLGDRRMMGGYIQVAQPLWRRKMTRLPGLILQYRFDYADPDLDTPGVTAGGDPILSDFSDQYLYDEGLSAHVFGLRFPVLPRFALKAEYGLLLEEGGTTNQLYNNFFALQAVADF